MNDPDPKIYEIADGGVGVWTVPRGTIFLRLRSDTQESVELSGREALSLANLLRQLVHELPPTS